MNQSAHNIEGVNRTQNMWFHPFFFTGIEKDEETGYGYFGARYMDHDLMTLWLSVDPMADKYPSIYPYAYCAWNPIHLVDSDGREIDDYYNLMGELIKKTSTGNNKYLVITEGKEVIEDRTIAVPTQSTIDKMDNILNGNIKGDYIVEKGIAVESNGNSSSIVTGTVNRINKEQWGQAFEEIKKRDGEVNYLVHLHPLDLYNMSIGSPHPSGTDRNAENFFVSKIGVILSFEQIWDPGSIGVSINPKDYNPMVSFYNSTSKEAIYKMSFKSFNMLVNNINKK